MVIAVQNGREGGRRYDRELAALRSALEEADSIVIGAGAGLSTSAGFTYNGARFARYFADFGEQYGFHDMYTGGFWPYETLEEHWAYWSRYIYINRFMNPPKPVYERLYELVRDRDYCVITTNVDHCFQKAGFEKERLFYTQGDYGLFQCSEPCHAETYDNQELVKAMLAEQGFTFDGEGALSPLQPEMVGLRKEEGAVKMRIPTSLVPRCPVCGKPMTMNLRADDTFVEDDGWHQAAQRYQRFLKSRAHGRILYLELGVGYNTPIIIKYPFWQLTAENEDAVYVCINQGDAVCPQEIRRRSICINADIGEVLDRL